MSNPHRSEVGFEVDGKAYKLHYSTNALCELEDALGIGVAEVAGIMCDPARMRLKTTRAMFWAGLSDHHADVDVKAAGDLMTALGMHRAIELIGKAFSLAFPTASPGAATGARPPKGQPKTAGTGPHS